MRVSAASESGRSDGRNEDWCGATDHIAVVLDGLSEGPETGCQHGTPWYVHQLGTRILTLAEEPNLSLAAALATAIRQVAELHRGTCNLEHPGSPGSTAAIVRRRYETVDYLVLADSVVVLDRSGAPLVITDRAVNNFEPEKAMAAAAGAGKPDRRALDDLIEAQQKVRNRPGGYWIAQVNPDAALHAQTGSLPGAEVRGAVLLSDGAALLVTDFKVMDWRRLLTLAYERGPGELIAMTRQLEDRDPHGVVWPRYKHRDDATAIVCEMT